MKLIHCADIHLDAPLSANLDKEKQKVRRAEILHSFLRMVSYAEQEDVTGILISGDLFDTAYVNLTTRNAIRDTVLAHPNLLFFYLRGNHDSDCFLQSLDEIPDNLKLFGDTWRTYVLEENGVEITISGLELLKKRTGEVFSSLKLKEDCLNIVMLHGQEQAYAGENKADCIPIHLLRGKAIDYLALGHVHAYKHAKLDERGMFVYPGCLEGRGFDECGKHGFCMLSVDTRHHKITEKFVPFATRLLHTIPVDISGCNSTGQLETVVTRKLMECAVSNQDLVKIVLTGDICETAEMDLDLLTCSLSDQYFFVKVSDETKIEVDYGQFMYDQTLKGAFVREVQKANNLSKQEKAKIIRTGILALAGEEIV